MATAFAMTEESCPFHGGSDRIAPHDALVFPLAKSAFVQFVGGGAELTLFHGDKEITFESEGQIAFATGLVKQERFRAADALGWTFLGWDEVSEMLADLVDSGVLAHADRFDGPVALDKDERPSPLPPAPADRPRSWREPELLAELGGRPLETGYLEVVVPVFRVAHPYLDRDGRQVGEANVFPRTLRIEAPAEWRTCTYSGTRYQSAKPINLTALKAMGNNWRPMMALLAEIRAAYLRRYPEAATGWTVGHVERLSTLVLALPSWLLLREQGGVANGDLHPALSNLFRVTDGLRMAVHQMMFIPIGEEMRPLDAPTDAAEILAYAERNFSFHSDHGVCAGPQLMIEEFLAVLLDGAAPRMGWPEALDADLQAAVAEIEPALDYGLLGLQTHAATFSIWAAMTRAYEQVAIALNESEASDGEAARAFDGHRRHVAEHTYLRHEAWRRHREVAYAGIHAGCAVGLGDDWASAPFTDRLVVEPVDGATAAALQQALPSFSAAATAAIAAFLARGQEILRAVEASQSAINALLGRPLPLRPLTLRDIEVHNTLIGQPRGLPFLLDEIERLFGVAIDADAVRIRIDSAQQFDGIPPAETPRRRRRIHPGRVTMKIKTNLRAGKGGASGSGQNGNGGTDNTTVDTSSNQATGTVGFYYPPVSRCPGI